MKILLRWHMHGLHGLNHKNAQAERNEGRSEPKASIRYMICRIESVLKNQLHNRIIDENSPS
jgi:hypothetical protein